MNNSDQPAFPASGEFTTRTFGVSGGSGSLSDQIVTAVTQQFNGLTKREYFAAMAMQGIHASYINNARTETVSVSKIAKWAVHSADALLKELENTNPKNK